jgi:membrane-bound serine protease (ClpP class)
VALFLFLVILGVVLVVAELFLPGGIVGTIGVILLVASIVVAYRSFDRGTAHVVLAFAVLAFAAGIWWWLRVFPHSRFADRIVIRSIVSSPDHGLDHLVGKRGTASSPLRPAGTAEIDGEWFDVVADGAFVTSGSEIEVLRVQGNRVVVRGARPPA